MAKEITAINSPDNPITAVFLNEQGNLLRKRTILCAFTDTQNPRNSEVVPMVWRDSKQAFYRVDEFSSFLGIEEDGKKDWSHVVNGAQQMQQTAQQITDQLEQDMQRSRQPEVQQGPPRSQRDMDWDGNPASQQQRGGKYDFEGSGQGPRSVGGPSQEYREQRQPQARNNDFNQAREQPRNEPPQEEEPKKEKSGFDKFKPWG